MAYALFFLGIFAGFGFYRILIGKWKLELLKDLTIVLILCGLLFSTLSYLKSARDIKFDPTMSEALQGIEKNVENGTILSYPGYGFAIEYYTENPVVADYLSSQKAINLSDTLFRLRNLDEFERLAEQNNIKYIVITPEMNQGLVWDREDQGLLFLLKNSESFNSVFDKNGYEVWEIK